MLLGEGSSFKIFKKKINLGHPYNKQKTLSTLAHLIVSHENYILYRYILFNKSYVPDGPHCIVDDT